MMMISWDIKKYHGDIRGIYWDITNDHGIQLLPGWAGGSPTWVPGRLRCDTKRSSSRWFINACARRYTMISWFMVYLGLWWVYHCQLGGIMRHHKPQLA